MLWWFISNGELITLPSGNKLPFVRGDFVIFNELYTMQPGMPNTRTGATIHEIKCEAIEDEIRLGLRYQEPTTGKWICDPAPWRC